VLPLSHAVSRDVSELER